MERYRVLRPPTSGEGLLLDGSHSPVTVAASGHESSVSELRPGYLIDAALDWSTERPTIEALSLQRPTLFGFVDDAEPMFEAARETWQAATRSGDGMNSRVTRNTDNAVNGVLYTFADPDGECYEEFRTGRRPIDPLIERINESRERAPREVFVLSPPDGSYVVVTITLTKEGQFANTIRDTYDLPRPTEPLADE